MVEVSNYTPFANLHFSNLDAKGKEFGVLMVKTAMDIADDGGSAFSTEQEPFVLTDEYVGELNTSSVRYPSDFVPYKPTSDVILDATAYAPGGQPARSWLVGIRIRDDNGVVVQKRLQITGPRRWIPRWKRSLSKSEQENWQEHKQLFLGWELSEPEPIDRLDIRYEYAFGGTIERGADDEGNPVLDAYEYNPIGCGLIDPRWTDHTKPQPAPQIEDPDNPVREPYIDYKPEGFGPIPPAWLPRRPLGGTYDQNWMDNVWPNWAEDYDFRFHNSAPEDLQTEKFLEGELEIELVNLHPGQERWTIVVPDSRPVVSAVEATVETDVLNMSRDTVFIEIAEEFRNDCRLFSVWRTPFDALQTEMMCLFNATQENLTDVDLRQTFPSEVACEPGKLDADPKEQAA